MQTFQMLDKKYDDPVHIRDENVSEDGRYVSEEEYWEKYYHHPDFNYEWKNGRLEEKPMADHKSYLMYKWFLKLADQFLTVHPIAEMTGLEIGFRLELPEDDSVRKPDMAIVLNNNPVMLHLTDCNFDGIFDLCIESLSYSAPDEIKRDTVDKKKEYQGVGVREYYILDARGLETAFYRLNEKGKYQKIKPVRKDIIRSEVLPGFQFRIRDLYEQPSLEKLTEDEVYQGYVLPFHQEVKMKALKAEKTAESERQRAQSEKKKAALERKRAESEKKKAAKERQRAEQIGLQLIAERQRAAMLADKLKQLGISIE